MNDEEAEDIAHNLLRIKCEEGRGTPEEAATWLQNELQRSLFRMLMGMENA